MPLSPQIYKGVYCAKLLMAYFVIAIHTTRWTLMGLLDTAVPYFFLANGFFLFGKLTGDKKKDLSVIKLWIIKVSILYFVWTLIYLPFAIVHFRSEELPFMTAIAVYTRNVLLVGENLYSCQLWYLLALIWGGSIIYFLRLANTPPWVMFMIGLSFYIGADLLHLEEVPLYVKLFKTTRNGLFFGLLFITGGGLVRQWVKNDTSTVSVYWIIATGIISLAVFQYSKWFIFPLSACLLLLSLRLSLPVLKKETSQRIGDMSKVTTWFI